MMDDSEFCLGRNASRKTRWIAWIHNLKNFDIPDGKHGQSQLGSSESKTFSRCSQFHKQFLDMPTQHPKVCVVIQCQSPEYPEQKTLAEAAYANSEATYLIWSSPRALHISIVPALEGRQKFGRYQVSVGATGAKICLCCVPVPYCAGNSLVPVRRMRGNYCVIRMWRTHCTVIYIQSVLYIRSSAVQSTVL